MPGKRISVRVLTRPVGQLNDHPVDPFQTVFKNRSILFLQDRRPDLDAVVGGDRNQEAVKGPARNGAKYFSTATLMELRNDPQWLARASDAVTRYWKHKSGCKSQSVTETGV